MEYVLQHIFTARPDFIKETFSFETDRRKKMMFPMPLYEVRYNDWEEWQEISEIDLMNELYKIYEKVSPAIKEMIKGKEIVTSEAVYRLKLERVNNWKSRYFNWYATRNN
jgi:hypothetical protein